MKVDFVVKNIAELATPVSSKEFKPGEFLSIDGSAIAVSEGKITKVGKNDDVLSQIVRTPATVILDASNKTVTPGFVDCHTHPIFYGTRENEFEMRIAGNSYEQIAAAGGGIRSSVGMLRKASKEDLIQTILPRLDKFLSLGTTTIEAKSGYGLTLEDEVKSLEAISELNKLHPIDLVPTFLGAHEVPDEFRSKRSAYIDLIINEMIPVVAEQKLAEFCDIFCETSVFSLEESRKILQAAKDAGFMLKIHSDQLTRNGGTSLAADLKATSADHLEYTSENDWQKMMEHKVVPVLLPGAVFFLGKKKYAEAREMLEVGLPVALATDFNPGTCMCESMPLILTLACLKLKMKPSEALTAATYHSALAINRGNLIGSLEVGKNADFVIWDIPNHKHIPYHFGVNLVSKVVKNGKVAYSNDKIK